MDEKTIEQYKSWALKPGAKFKFRCTECGECCKNRCDIILTPRDIYRAAKKLKQTPKEFITENCISIIGESSKLPLFLLRPVGADRRCPLLQEDGHCRIHDVKPFVCAQYPLGRMFEYNKENPDAKPNAVYFLQPTECGAKDSEYTVEEWFAQFGLTPDDEFTDLWNQTISQVSRMLHDVIDATSAKAMEFQKKNDFDSVLRLAAEVAAVQIEVTRKFYMEFDTEQELLPQLKANVKLLTESIQEGLEAYKK